MKRSSKFSRKRFWARLFLGGLLSVSVCVLSIAVLLKRGIAFDSLNIGSVSVSDISLHWEKKLDLQVEKVVLASAQKGELPEDFSMIDKGIRACIWGSKVFSSISVREINLDEMKASLYLGPEASYFTFTGQGMEIQADMAIDHDNTFLIDVTKAASKQYNSHLTGRVRINGQTDRASGSFSAVLGGALPVTVDFNADPRQISFQGEEAGKITNITPFVDLFGLSHNIQRWITDYLTGSRYELKSFAGNFPWKDPFVLLDSFYAEVRVIDCQYTFAPGLDAIKTDYTDVVFKKGILTIIPRESTFYGQAGEDSWLDINFNDFDNILLTAHIQTNAQANQDIVNLVEYYDIPLPFRQTKGKTGADLTLSVNLNTEVVTAHGIFLIEEGCVDYQQENYGVQNTRIILDDKRITLEQLHIWFEEMFAADIVGTFDAGNGTGKLDITLQKGAFEIGESSLILDGSEPKPTLHYTISPEGATITAEASSWTTGAFPLKLGSFTAPFSLDELSGHIPPTTLSFPPFVSTEISGTFSIKEQQVDLKCNLLQYHSKDVKLAETKMPLSIQYDKELTIRSKKESQWLLNTIPVTLYPSEFKFSDNIYSVTSGRISYGEFFDSTISGFYNHLIDQGRFYLEDLDIKEETIGHFLTPGNALSIEVDGRNEMLLLKVPELDMELTSGENKSWSLLFKDLGAVYDHSPLLQRYMVDKGSLGIMSKNGGGYSFSANIPYGYSLLIKDTIPVDLYQIYGEFSEDGFQALINKDIQIAYDDGLTITTQDVAFNVPVVIQLLKDISKSGSTDSEDPKKGLRCTLESRKTSLVFTPERQLIADKITLEYLNGKTALQLQHGQGAISVDVEREEFSLAGDGLNDIFMDGLFSGSEFHGGTMSVAAKGRFDDFTALVKIENTIMKDFKTLNNVLALVNTIPALVTFSLPSYSTQGLPVDTILAGVRVTDGVATLNSLNIESPEISIVGNGWIDFPQKKIAMDLNLITRAKKNVSKIPLVGYILVGKKKRPSITVQVSGDLFDPKVEYLTFQEVASEPFYMLYRTLALPAYLVAPMFSSDEDVQEEDQSVEKEKDLEREEKWAE